MEQLRVPQVSTMTSAYLELQSTGTFFGSLPVQGRILS
jgi:hypothetical protein